MSIKNIVTGQVSSITTYTVDGEVTDISTTGNITGGNIIGNGSQLTGMYGDANVAAYLPTYTGSLGDLTGDVTTTGNITSAYFIGNGSQLTGIASSSYGNANVAAYLPTFTGNIGNTGNSVGNLFVANLRNTDGTTFVTKLNNEWWIDPVTGNDTTGKGTITAPYKTIAKALTASSPNGEVYNLAAGPYTEAVTWTKPNILVVGPGQGQLADLQGLQTINLTNGTGSIRFQDVGMQDVTIISPSQATYFYDCHIQGTITKSGGGYVSFDGNDVATGPINVTGAGVVLFRNSIVDTLTVNNAGAAASLLSCTSEVANYTLTAGVLGIVASQLVTTVNAPIVTTSAGSLFVTNATTYGESDLTPARLNLGGFWSMGSVSFDSANSTITGTNYGSPSYSDALVAFGTITAVGSITNTRVTPRIGTVASSATVTPVGNSNDQYNVTALATGATIAAPTGTPTDGQKLTLRIKDNGTAQTLTWNAIYRAIGTTLPTTTVATKTTYVGLIYNVAAVKWDCVSVAQEA